jgi:AbrB family looped-hinge helix DNA binding protein
VNGPQRCALSRAFLLFRISDMLQDMKATVTINSRGVVTLPAKLRQALGLKADDVLIAETTPEGLLLRPSVTLPLEVYTPEREREFDEAEAELAAVLGEVAASAAAAPGSRVRRRR